MNAPAHSNPSDELDYSARSIQNIRRSAALLAILLCVYTVFVSWIAWREVRNEQIGKLSTLVDLESKAIDVYFRNMEGGLIALGQDLQTADALRDLDTAHVLLRRFLELHPELANVSLIAPNGTIFVTALTSPDQTLASTAGQPSFEEFLRFASAGQNFAVSKPVTGAVSGVPMVPMRLAVRTVSDQVAFILSAALPEDYLSAYWKDAPVMPRTSIGILRDDGYFVSLYPIPAGVASDQLYGEPRAPVLLANMQRDSMPQKGYLQTYSRTANEDVMSAFHRLPGYPLSLYVASSMANIRAAWLDRIGATYLSILLLICAGAVAYRMALRRQAVWNVRQRASDDALRASEMRFRSLIDGNNAVILQLDSETGQIIDANDAAARFYGWPRAELLSMSIIDLNMLGSENFQARARAIHSGESGLLIRQHRLASGEIRIVEANVTPLSMDGRQIFVSIITDITQRERAEEQTRTLLGEHEAILNSSVAGIAKIRKRSFVWVNEAFAQSLGYRAVELEGQPSRILYATEADYLAFGLRAYPAMRTLPFFSEEHQLRCKDGTLKWFEIRGAVPKTSDIESLWSLNDISERRENTRRIENLLVEQRAILNNRLVGIVTVTKNRHVLWANQAFCDMLEHAPEDVIGKSTRMFYNEDRDWAQLGDQAYPALSRSEIYRGETRFITKHGKKIWAEISSHALDAASGESLWCFIDITQRKHIEQELQESTARLTAIIENEPESIKILDAQGIIRQINPGGVALIEAESASALLGRLYVDFVAPEYRAAYESLHRRVMRGERVMLEYEIIGLRGTRRWLETHAVPMTDHGATVELSVARDITERKRIYTRVRQLAFQDSLTGLPNRRLLIDRLEQGMSASKRNETFGAVLFVDLDNFKPLNDSQGHEAGDLLLVEVARRLRGCVREIDTVARFGGDEFVIVLSLLAPNKDESEAQAIAVAEKIRQSLAQPYALTITAPDRSTVNLTHSCTASIGVALFFGRNASQDEILKRADAAMYKAKQAGRDCVRIAGADTQA